MNANIELGGWGGRFIHAADTPGWIPASVAVRLFVASEGSCPCHGSDLLLCLVACSIPKPSMSDNCSVWKIGLSN